MTKLSRCIRVVITIASIAVAAGCAHAPTATQTVAVPPARSVDVLDVAVEAARAVGLPAVTKLDKAGGVVEFGSFETPATGYAAQARRRPDGQLDVTVKRGSANGAGTVEDKAREFVAAVDARLRQVPPSSVPPPQPPRATPAPPPARPPAAPPSAPPTPPAPSPAVAAPAAPAITRVIIVPQANLRERGDLSAKIVRVVPKNTRVTVLGSANQWYLVRLDDGTEGWLAESVTSPAKRLQHLVHAAREVEGPLRGNQAKERGNDVVRAIVDVIEDERACEGSAERGRLL
jgi:hypothetical protein